MCTRLRAISVLRQRHHSALGAIAIAEEVPELDSVAGRIEEVGGAIAPLVLDRPLDLDPPLAQLPAERVQTLGADRQGEMYVAAAPVGVLFLTGRPDAKPAVLAGPQPDPVLFFGQQPPQPQLFVEALKTLDVVGLQDQLADSGDAHVPGFPFHDQLKPSLNQRRSRGVIAAPAAPQVRFSGA